VTENPAERRGSVSLVQVRIGGRTYDAVYHNGCLTCTHPARKEIEEQIILGTSYRRVATMYSETEWTQPDGTKITLPKVSWDNLFHHFKNEHLPVQAAVYREILDKRAAELSEHYEEQTARLVDGYSFAQQVLARTQEGLATGTLQPDIKDGLAAAKLIKEMEQVGNGASADAEAWGQAMAVYFETARKFMPDDMWQNFTQALMANPILQAIQNRRSALESNQDYEDGEVVHEERNP
jgi:hypothetical protein